MTEVEDGDYTNPTYTVTLNNKVYALTNSFREAIARRAEQEYSENQRFSCWWKVASEPSDGASSKEWKMWNDNPHEDGDPILVIETVGTTVPWERLDQLDVDMNPMGMVVMEEEEDSDGGDSDRDDIDAGNGMKTVPPEDVDMSDPDHEIDVGRTHFGLTPHRYEDVPDPGSDDPEKVPPKPDEVDGPMLVKWIPDNPNIEHTWSTGEAITDMDSWVEWNIQLRADQPRGEKPTSHDAFESLLRHHGCPVVGEPTTQEIPEDSGSVKRKGKDAFKNGKYGGSNWTV